MTMKIRRSLSQLHKRERKGRQRRRERTKRRLTKRRGMPTERRGKRGREEIPVTNTMVVTDTEM